MTTAQQKKAEEAKASKADEKQDDDEAKVQENLKSAEDAPERDDKKVDFSTAVVDRKEHDEVKDSDEEYTYLTNDHFPKGSKGLRTSDWDDENRSWHAQATGDDDKDAEDSHGKALIDAAAQPGQTFHPSELPDPEKMKEAGIDPYQWLVGLPVKGKVSALED